MSGPRIALAALCAAVVLSCASHPVLQGPVRVEASEDAEATVAESDERAEPPAEPPGGHGEQVTAPQPAQFKVSDELYVKTFSEIEEVIAKVSATIAAKDYDGWVQWLSPEYVARTGSAGYLEEASESPALAKTGIRLASLADYFNFVVVPSRTRATLDRIDFVDATHVKAIAIIGGEAYILYWLVRDAASWKIGSW